MGPPDYSFRAASAGKYSHATGMLVLPYWVSVSRSQEHPQCSGPSSVSRTAVLLLLVLPCSHGSSKLPLLMHHSG